jgi:hypothetical protein
VGFRKGLAPDPKNEEIDYDKISLSLYVVISTGEHDLCGSTTRQGFEDIGNVFAT